MLHLRLKEELRFLCENGFSLATLLHPLLSVLQEGVPAVGGADLPAAGGADLPAAVADLPAPIRRHLDAYVHSEEDLGGQLAAIDALMLSEYRQRAVFSFRPESQDFHACIGAETSSKNCKEIATATSKWCCARTGTKNFRSNVRFYQNEVPSVCTGASLAGTQIHVFSRFGSISQMLPGSSLFFDLLPLSDQTI